VIYLISQSSRVTQDMKVVYKPGETVGKLGK